MFASATRGSIDDVDQRRAVNGLTLLCASLWMENRAVGVLSTGRRGGWLWSVLKQTTDEAFDVVFEYGDPFHPDPGRGL